MVVGPPFSGYARFEGVGRCTQLAHLNPTLALVSTFTSLAGSESIAGERSRPKGLFTSVAVGRSATGQRVRTLSGGRAVIGRKVVIDCLAAPSGAPLSSALM